MPPVIKRIDAENIRIIASVNREETIDANYAARPTPDGWGLALRKTPCAPPIDVSRWDDEDVAERIARWAPELAKGGSMLGAFDGSRLAGFTVAGHKRSDGTAELSAIFVDKDYRGKSIGSALMRAAEDDARRRGVRAMYIMSVPTARTVDFYIAQGYRIVSIIDKSLTPGLPWDVVLAKAL